MSQYVVIGTSPSVDTAVVVGPYRTYDRALVASSELVYMGYITETCELLSTSQLEQQGFMDWSGSDE